MRETVDTTYADLRPTDLVIDKSGQAWPVKIIGGALDGNYPEITFWLQDSVTKINMHLLVKAKVDPVKVSRLPTQADEAAKLEAEFLEVLTEDDKIVTTPLSDSFATMAEAVASVEAIGGEVEVTSAEVDAANAATDDAPVSLPLFANMDILSQRSHLYLLHGVFAHDMKSRQETIAMHDQADADREAGKLQGRYIPHVHAEVK